MHLTVFGGTGPTGQLLIQQALAEGHDVVAYARSPGKLPHHQRLTAVEGLLDDGPAIAEAVRGSDAVLSVLGPGRDATDVPPLVTGTRAIVAAMKAHGVERLVAIGTPSITDPQDGASLKIRLMVAAIRKFQPVAYAAIVEIGEIVRTSGLQWTVVRVPLLTNGPATGSVRARHIGSGGIRLARANAAAFLLDQATDPTWVGGAPFISDR